MVFATHLDDNFIQMLLVIGSRTVPTDALSEVLTKAVDPKSNGLAADSDTSLRQKVLNFRRAQGEAVIRPNCVGDDLTG